MRLLSLLVVLGCGDKDEAECEIVDGYTDGDGDGDGYGGSSSVSACEAPDDDHTLLAGDCDDDDRAFPGNPENCDRVDNNCDGSVDEGVLITVYTDGDNDGFGNPATEATVCSPLLSQVLNGADCNDLRPGINPDALEICDGLDNNCDGTTDTDAVDKETFYADADGDGFGDPGSSTEGCDAPAGYLALSGPSDADCDDTDSASNPSADEVCDSADNDCDGTTDEDPVDGETYYTDDDGDGYGDGAVFACSQPSGTSADAGDCDDADSDISPGASEDCSDNIDNDCDDALDCLDDDCGDCAEVCDDGEDNDEDGLTDCEDGECAIECAEVCDDGEDNDEDGTTDCSDDDCLWHETCGHHPAGVRAAVTGGHMEQAILEDGAYFSFMTDVNRTFFTSTMTGVTGTVQVLPPYFSSWGSTSARTTCSWGVDTVAVESLRESYFGTRSIAEELDRSGFWIDSGCRISTSGFLPEYILGAKLKAWRANTDSSSFIGHTRVDVWYSGAMLSSFTSTSSRTSMNSSGGIRTRSWEDYTWLSASIQAGDTYHFYP